MVKQKFSLFLFFLSSFLLLVNCGKSEELKEEPKEQSVQIYLTALQGSKLNGKVIGCNDKLIGIERKIIVERSPIETAINQLIMEKPAEVEELRNFVKGPQLMLVQVTIAAGIADVYLTGDFDISTVCDISRIQEQLYETAKQFTDLKKVNFFINNQTLENYLSIAKESF
ncbi:MAG: GerMN domain-containing protein [Ignavibacteriales bacterium]|nr:GerMN domain-containing protein [Ignavibacteriales bacterium]